MFTVLVLTVLVDLITAVAVGVVMASLQFVQGMAKLQQQNIIGVREGCGAEKAGLSPEEGRVIEASHGQIVLFRLSGPMSFGAAQSMSRSLAIAESFRAMVLDLTDVSFLDSSAAMAIEEIIDLAQSSGARVLLVGLRPEVGRILNRLGVLRKLGRNHRFRYRLSALRHAQGLLDASPEDVAAA